MIVEASPSNRWKSRDLPIAVLLFGATALWVLWQNSRVAVLWDLGYLLNTSHRIAAGQIPYRDFSLVHPPITFLIQAAIEGLFGRHYEYIIAYAAIAGGAASVLAWRIILHIFHDKPNARFSALLLTLPLPVLGIYSVYPHPIYDSDATLSILIAILLVQRATRPAASWQVRLIAGASCALPLLVKQNIGLPFLAATLFALFLSLIVRNRPRLSGVCEQLSNAAIIHIVSGCIAALGAGAALIQLTSGLGNYLHWTVQFAAQRRLPAATTILSLYTEPSLLWTLPLFAAGLALLFSAYSRRKWVQVVRICLTAAPFVATLTILFVEQNSEDRADRLLALWPLLLLSAAIIALYELRKGITFARLIPFLVLAAIHGTFLSQEVWGSTYAIWPLLILLIASVLVALPSHVSRAVPILAGVIGTTLLICGGFYSASLERLNYIYIPEDQALVKAWLPALKGISTRGTYLPDFEQLVQYVTSEIPEHDGVLLLPGEEPFFYATGRVPRLPVLLFDRTTNPYTPEELMAAAEHQGIHWVIVKTRLQSNEDPFPEQERLIELLQPQFQLYKRLDGYDVYHSNFRAGY